MRISVFRLVISSLAFVLVVACSDAAEQSSKQSQASLVEQKTIVLDVYKRAACSCCSKWISHANQNGLKTVAHNENDLSTIKNKYGIHAKLRSCHTSVTQDGYVFEGHIPAKFIKQFIQEKPSGAKGLAVPAMPTGTPGMEFGDLHQPYKIYLLKNDGSIKVYAEVNTAEEQI
jgi:hypothetical protein